jgi:hypothetical protein
LECDFGVLGNILVPLNLSENYQWFQHKRKGKINLKLKRSYGENMYQPIHIVKIAEETYFTKFHIEKIISCVMLIIARIVLVMLTQNM